MARTAIPLHERFERHVSPEPMSGCWLWTGALSIYGYGEIWIGDRPARAHRVSWDLHRAPIPDGLLHRCDVRCCVNPDHLFLGTIAENTRDMDRKGRRQVARGEASGPATRSDEAVAEMRRQRVAGQSYRSIATAFGVSLSTAYYAVRGETWAHVGEVAHGAV